jgi:mannose-6-phosphate isomerase-like protein (cupin superfamily)
MTGTRGPADFPYDTRLDILKGPLETIDVQAVADAVTHPWFNQTLCQVNDSVVRVGVIRGEYHWHKHDHDDEFFYVVDGRLLIDLEPRGSIEESMGSTDQSRVSTEAPHRTVELLPRQGFVVPKGVVHRTRAPERAIILMVENAGIVPTGDA